MTVELKNDIETKMEVTALDIKREHLVSLHSKKMIAASNACIIERLSEYLPEGIEKNNMLKEADRIRRCMNFWKWDKYFNNKLLDLQKVYRCESKFCPNCRSINSAIAIKKFRKRIDNLAIEDVEYKFITLTIPNISMLELSKKITEINNAFAKLYEWLSYEIGIKGFKNRIFHVIGAVRMDEFTISYNGAFNLHIHAIILMDWWDEKDFIYEVPAYWREKSGEQVYLSFAELWLAKLWTMAVNGEPLRDFGKRSLEFNDNYTVNIRNIDIPEGLYEAYKYSFKDLQINRLDFFSAVYYGIKNHKLRQSYGVLYGIENYKLRENFYEVQISIDEFLRFDEVPEVVFSSSINDVIENYQEYRKISRSNCFREYYKIKD
jgi:plasmid rolling circle replication initiator protein Rep